MNHFIQIFKIKSPDRDLELLHEETVEGGDPHAARDKVRRAYEDAHPEARDLLTYGKTRP